IKWFKNGLIDHPLLIAFEDGWLQLMKNETDDFPVLINTELKISSAEWNYAGDMFAVTGNAISAQNCGCLLSNFTVSQVMAKLRRPWERITSNCTATKAKCFR